MATLLQTVCPTPFLSLGDFPYTAGSNDSRVCAPSPLGKAMCCLPCPLTDWVYPDSFKEASNVANWIALGSVIACCFLLSSYACLPVQKTSRHYLTIGLIAGTGLLTLSLVIPLGAKPNQCHDKITPNDMYSDVACAFSGSLVLFGGFAAVMWIFIRSLSLHLQICWQIVPGRKFFLGSLAAGWLIPALSLGLSLGLSGVSYRFGNICHINHKRSLGTFWVPILVFTGSAAILQFITFGYCVRVYVRSLMDPNTTSGASSNAPSALPSFQGSSIKTMSARATYRRVKKVIALQWRGIMVVIVLLISVVYFATVFITLDEKTSNEAENFSSIEPWLLCLVTNNGDKNKCLNLAGALILNEPTVLTVLYLLSFMGYWNMLFLAKLSMFSGWWTIIRAPFRGSRDHFVSYDARRFSDQRNYEMLTSPPQSYHMIKGDTGLVATAKQPLEKDPSPSQGNRVPPEANYHGTTHSFSQPRPPSRTASQAGRVTFSREKDPLKPGSQPTTSLAERYQDGSHRTVPASEREWPRSRPAPSSTSYRSNSALGTNRDIPTYTTRSGISGNDQKEWNGGP